MTDNDYQQLEDLLEKAIRHQSKNYLRCSIVKDPDLYDYAINELLDQSDDDKKTNYTRDIINSIMIIFLTGSFTNDRGDKGIELFAGVSLGAAECIFMYIKEIIENRNIYICDCDNNHNFKSEY